MHSDESSASERHSVELMHSSRSPRCFCSPDTMAIQKMFSEEHSPSSNRASPRFLLEEKVLNCNEANAWNSTFEPGRRTSHVRIITQRKESVRNESVRIECYSHKEPTWWLASIKSILCNQRLPTLSKCTIVAWANWKQNQNSQLRITTHDENVGFESRGNESRPFN